MRHQDHSDQVRVVWWYRRGGRWSELNRLDLQRQHSRCGPTRTSWSNMQVASRAAAVKDQQSPQESESRVSWSIQTSVCWVSVDSSSLLLLTLSWHSDSSVNFYFIKCLFLFHSWTQVLTLWEENVSHEMECSPVDGRTCETVIFTCGSHSWTRGNKTR